MEIIRAIFSLSLANGVNWQLYNLMKTSSSSEIDWITLKLRFNMWSMSMMRTPCQRSLKTISILTLYDRQFNSQLFKCKKEEIVNDDWWFGKRQSSRAYVERQSKSRVHKLAQGIVSVARLSSHRVLFRWKLGWITYRLIVTSVKYCFSAYTFPQGFDNIQTVQLLLFLYFSCSNKIIRKEFWRFFSHEQ